MRQILRLSHDGFPGRPRLAIGWHFFFEGVHKLDSFRYGNKVFSSASYFRLAPGPLAEEMNKRLGESDGDALALAHSPARQCRQA